MAMYGFRVASLRVSTEAVLKAEAREKKQRARDRAKKPHTRNHRAYRQGGQSSIPSEFAPKKLDHNVTDQRGCNGNREISAGQDVRDGPLQSHLPSHSRALVFTHEKVGIE